MKIIVNYIPNILDKKKRKSFTYLYDKENPKLSYYLDKTPIDWRSQKIIINNLSIKNIDDAKVLPGDIVIITKEVKFQAIAAIASFIVTAAQTTWVQIAVLVLTTAYSIYSALNAPSLPTFNANSEGLDEGSPTYSWDGIHTTQEVGIPIPIIYGEHKVGGNIINQFIETDGDKNYLNLLLAIGEGEIESIDEIKINDNPAANFDGITQYTRMGTSNQSVIPNFNDLNNSYTVNVTLTKDSAYTYTTINDDVEKFVLTFNLPQGLFQQDGNTGSIKSWSVTYKVEYKLTTSGTWIDLGSTTITGLNRSALRRTFTKDALAAGKYDIRVTRTSANSSLDPTKTGELILLNVNEVQTDDLSYPNVALLGIKALATNQLSGQTPNFTTVVKGRKVNVPKVLNGMDEVDWEDYYWDPGANEFKLLSDDTSLTWDGSTYVDKWSANPVWCFRDLLTNTRYGLGDYIDSNQITLADWVEMAKYCEEKVDDGSGSYEKRYRLDVVIDSHTKALDLVVQLAATFDAFVFYSEGSIQLRIDKDEDPVQNFGMGNIVKNSLRQSWRTKKESYNQIEVQYVDKDKDYRLETISVIDDDAIAAGEELKLKQIRVFTTRTSYAVRAARRALKIAQLVNRTITFRAGIDALAVSPGDPIALSHDTPQIGFSGRVQSGSTTSTINLDQEVTIETGKSYVLIVQFADDTIEELTVTNSPGSASAITVSPAASQTPAAFDRYAFGEENIATKPFRLLNVQINDNLEATLTAIEMDSNVYDDTAPVIPTDNYSLLSTDIPNVNDLDVTEMIRLAGDGTLFNTLEVWWRKPEAASYQLNQYVKAKIFLSDDGGSTFVYVGETDTEKFVVTENIDVGVEYTVAVVSVSGNGMENAIADSPQATHTVVGKTAPPSDVTNFDVTQRGDKLVFSFDPIPDGDLARYIIKKGGDWNTGDIIAERIDATEFETPVGSIGSQTYMIKAIDTSDNESTNVTQDTINVTPPPEMNFVEDIDPWALNREYKITNIARVQSNLYDKSYTRDVFTLQTDDTWQDLEDLGQGWDQLAEGGNLDFDKTYVSSGTIEQIEAVDLGSIFEFDVILDLEYQNVSGGSISVEISHSEDNVTFSSWETVTASAQFRARYVKFRYTLATSDTSHNVLFYAATISINAPNVKVDFGRDVSVPSGGVTINFRDDFTSEPRVTGLVIVDGTKGVPYVTAKDASSMTIKVRNLADSADIAAEVDWEVKGG